MKSKQGPTFFMLTLRMPNQLGLQAKKRPDLVVYFVVAHFVTIILKGVGSNYIITLFRVLPLTIFFYVKTTYYPNKKVNNVNDFLGGDKTKEFLARKLTFS